MFHDLWSAKLPTITRRYTTRKAYKINGEIVAVVPGIVSLAFDATGTNKPVWFSARGYHVFINGKRTGIQIHKPLDAHGDGWMVAASNGYFVSTYAVTLKSLETAAVWSYAAAHELDAIGAGVTRNSVNKFTERSTINWLDKSKSLAEWFAENEKKLFSIKRIFDEYTTLIGEKDNTAK